MKIQKVDETSGQELKLNAEKSSEQRYESLRGAFSFIFCSFVPIWFTGGNINRDLCSIWCGRREKP
ncbi:MAG: hypothetical protein WAP46_00390 [Dysgonamonadaceae bacterium]